MEIKSYRRIPLTVQALQRDGTELRDQELSQWLAEYGYRLSVSFVGNYVAFEKGRKSFVAETGNWIVKGEGEEFFACSDQRFFQIYEPVNSKTT